MQQRARLLWLPCLLLFLLACQASAESETTTYTNEAWGYSITYPSDYVLFDDPRTLKAVTEEAQANLDSSPESEVVRQTLEQVTGQQFALFYAGAEDQPVANLVMLIERVQVAGVTNEEYFQAAVSQVSKIKASMLDEPIRVDIQGREFFSQAYDISMQERTLHGVMFAHYDPSERIAYLFSITSDPDGDPREAEALRRVLDTFVIHDVGEAIDGESARLRFKEEGLLKVSGRQNHHVRSAHSS